MLTRPLHSNPDYTIEQTRAGFTASYKGEVILANSSYYSSAVIRCVGHNAARLNPAAVVTGK